MTSPIEKQMNKHFGDLNQIANNTVTEKERLQMILEINHNMEMITTTTNYGVFLRSLINVLLQILEDTPCKFFAEDDSQRLRKHILCTIQRIPTNDYFKDYYEMVMISCIKLLDSDNEENVVTAMKIIVELNKSYKPPYHHRIGTFIKFATKIYRDLPHHIDNIFKSHVSLTLGRTRERDLNLILNSIFTSTMFKCVEGYDARGSLVEVDKLILPRGTMSLKVMQELPIIIVLLFQLYKDNIKSDLLEFISYIVQTLKYTPPMELRRSHKYDREKYVDFIGVQVKAISFLAYITRIMQDTKITGDPDVVARGFINTLTSCPIEVMSLRRDLIVSLKQLLASDFKQTFIPYIDTLYGECVALGSSSMAYETLRMLVYTTLADFIHHVRERLTTPVLLKALNLFTMNVQDDTLTMSVQTMSAKSLLNLVDLVKYRANMEDVTAVQVANSQLTVKLIKILTLKYKIVVRVHLPYLLNRARSQIQQMQQQQQQLLLQQQENATTVGYTPEILDRLEELKKYVEDGCEAYAKIKKDIGMERYTLPFVMLPSYNAVDCRSHVRLLTTAARTIIAACSALGADMTQRTSVIFTPREVVLLVRMVKWSLSSFDVFSITPQNMQSVRANIQQTGRSKDEAEVLEHYYAIFAMLHPYTFKEIMTCIIKHLIGRMILNPSLQILNDKFLENPSMSAIYATTCTDYLLSELPKFGQLNQEKCAFFLKIYKSIFDSAASFNKESWVMIQPYLLRTVTQCMKIAKTAEEPYNYFLLQRVLFRAIGSGSRDLLYQEFLPLLPILVTTLNSLQAGSHKTHLKELFVELCLTVPARLSSLLPHLPMLMDPLISALNGSPQLVGQGLRTLELCVDNLQPDFLYNNIEPIRAELIHALYRMVNSPDESLASASFRVLGKLGGGNRKIMVEPQQLKFNTMLTGDKPTVDIHFDTYNTPVHLEIHQAITSAVCALKHASTEHHNRRFSWEVVKGFLIASIGPEECNFYNLFAHSSFLNGPIANYKDVIYKYHNKIIRNTHVAALTGLLTAVATKDLKNDVLPFMIAFVRHYALIMLAQQSGPFPISSKNRKFEGRMDTLVLAEAIAIVMSYEEKELCKPCRLALTIISNTCTTVLGSKERASELPFMEYLTEQLCNLCYESTWHAKMGGCDAINYLYTKMPINWVYKHLYKIVKALLSILADLSGEVSNGVVEQAKQNVEEVVKNCVTKLDPNTNRELIKLQQHAIWEIAYELTRQVTCPHDNLRDEAIFLLKMIGKEQNVNVSELMTPHKSVMMEIIPPKKHLLKHQAANSLIGLMEGNTFVTTLSPRLYSLDLTNAENQAFFDEIASICEATDEELSNTPCYRNIRNLVPLRKAALKALTSFNYAPGVSQKIFTGLYLATERSEAELQRCAYECIQDFISKCQMDMLLVHAIVKPFLATLCDFRNVGLTCARRLSYLVMLFPGSFRSNLYEQLLEHVKKYFECLLETNISTNPADIKHTEEIIAAIIDIFTCSPPARKMYLQSLCTIVLEGEKQLQAGPSSPYRIPLMKFLVLHPLETLVFFIDEKNIVKSEWVSYLEFLLKNEEGTAFRGAFHHPAVTERLTHYIEVSARPEMEYLESVGIARYNTIRIIALLSKLNETWLNEHPRVVNSLKQTWISEGYLKSFTDVIAVDIDSWREAKLICRILLHYFNLNQTDIPFLFNLLIAFTERSLLNFQFLREYLDVVVAQTFTNKWKRMVYEKYCETFPELSNDLKERILQYIIVPCFIVSFEKGQVEEIVAPTMPNAKNDCISIYMYKLVDYIKRNGCTNCVRLWVQHLGCLLVEYASHYLNTGKNTENKLREIIEFVWHALNKDKSADQVVTFHGHLLLANVISKMAINRRIILQVFRSLLLACHVEVRVVVKQTIDMVTPMIPTRVENGYYFLEQWTKQVITEEGHHLPQLLHIMYLIVRQSKVYYNVRTGLTSHIVSALQRLSNSNTSDYRKIAIDIVEVVVKWELLRSKNEEGMTGDVKPEVEIQPELPETSDSSDNLLLKQRATKNRPIDKVYAVAVLNCLTKLACQASDATSIASTGDALARRSLNILKFALKAEMWPAGYVDLNLGWMDRILCSPVALGANVPLICTALEIMNFVISAMKKEEALKLCLDLQGGIIICMSSYHPKIIQLLDPLITRIMNLFPVDVSTSMATTRHKELEKIYASVIRVITEGLMSYEKSTVVNNNLNMLNTSMMLLKAVCSSNQAFIDRFCSSLVKVMQRLSLEYHNITKDDNVPAEIMIDAIEMLKNRVGVMKIDSRKSFIGIVISGLIEHTCEPKLMKALIKVLEEWVTTGKDVGYRGPNVQEKSVLLIKMMHSIEYRFPDLTVEYLGVIYDIYTKEILNPTDLIQKLQLPFLFGLRCKLPECRDKFFNLINNSISSELIYKLLYIVSSQNWEGMGRHYWLKQCIQLVLSSAVPDTKLYLSNSEGMLPGATGNIDTKLQYLYKDDYYSEHRSQSSYNLEDIEKDLPEMENSNDITVNLGGVETLQIIVEKQMKFLKVANTYKGMDFINAICQICHADTKLSQTLWLNLFPQLWSILGDHQRVELGGEIPMFLTSGSHVIQKDVTPSAITTFYEAVMLCNPPITLKPMVMRYLGQSHNLWHHVTLSLENIIIEKNIAKQLKREPPTHDVGVLSPTETLDCLADMYCSLKEEDLWCILKQKHSKFSETVSGISDQQQGLFASATEHYENAIKSLRDKYMDSTIPDELQSEFTMIEKQWIKCGKELNRWEELLEFGRDIVYPALTLDSVWRLDRPDRLSIMKECIATLEKSASVIPNWKLSLMKGYFALSDTDENRQDLVERFATETTNQCLIEWRRLPAIVSSAHIPLLQAAHQIVELQEAHDIRKSLVRGDISKFGNEMKATLKTWKNRLPSIADDLSHWSDIFSWRQQNYDFIIKYLMQKDYISANTKNILPIHSAIGAYIQFGKIAQKHNALDVALSVLDQIYNIPNVPTIECFRKVRQQVKCYLHMPEVVKQRELRAVLKSLESAERVNLKYFNPEMTSEYFALKGMVSSYLGKDFEECNQYFSASMQLQDSLSKGWALWADFMEGVFESKSSKDLEMGKNTIVCLLNVCRFQSEPKARKYIARVIWILAQDNQKSQMMDSLDKYYNLVPLHAWLPWIQQLMWFVMSVEGKAVMSILGQVGRTYPQAVYLPVRTMYFAQKLERRERHKMNENPDISVPNLQTQGQDAIKASSAMLRCSNIMQHIREYYPTVLLALEGIVDQMVAFRDAPIEEVLKQLKLGLTKCYATAFDNRNDVANTRVSETTEHYLRTVTSVGFDTLSKKSHVTEVNPVYKKMMDIMSTDFKFDSPNFAKVQNLIPKLKKWIRLIEDKLAECDRTYLIEDKCRFLTHFCAQTAELEIPGELLLPKNPDYCVHIAKFLPRVEVIEKHNAIAKRISIRGHNGKVYKYLLMQEAIMSEARREETILQLLRMINDRLTKQKETARRFLMYKVPRVVALSPVLRLVEDNVSSLSLLDIFKQICKERGSTFDEPIAKYYEKLAMLQARGGGTNHNSIKEIFKDIEHTCVPSNLLKSWALKVYDSPSSFWNFRKMITSQLSLICFTEYVFHLTRLNTEMIFIHKDTGFINVSYFKFDVSDARGLNELLDANRPVPFRLTPNIVELINDFNIFGPMAANMIAIARCFLMPKNKILPIMRVIIKDEMTAAYRRIVNTDVVDDDDGKTEVERQEVVKMVNSAMGPILKRMSSLAKFDAGNSQAAMLLAAAKNSDNLCRMDPSWYPWF